jgi:hypothetical protein
VGACEKLADPDAPVRARTYVTDVEAFGTGTLAHDPGPGLGSQMALKTAPTTTQGPDPLIHCRGGGI